MGRTLISTEIQEGYTVEWAMVDSQHLKSKICLVGEAAVGKTSLVRRYVQDAFSDDYLMTLGTKVSKKIEQVATPGLTVRVDMAIWDIMGQPGLLDLVRDAYFTGAHGILAVADFTRLSSLERLQMWIRNVRQVAGTIPVLLVVNKNDRVREAQFTLEEVERLAPTYATGYVMTSAKTGENVEEAFRRMASLVVKSQLRLA